MKQALINCRQHEILIKVLMVNVIIVVHCLSQILTKLMHTTLLQHDIIFCAEYLDNLEENFKVKMGALKDTVQSKTAVPTAQVYVRIFQFINNYV